MRFARVNGRVVHFVDEGPRDAPALAFINSLGCDLRIWDDVSRILGRDFRIIRYDKRGHGLSESGPDLNDIADYARDLGALLDTLGVGKATIVGLSIGGLIAQELYRQRPSLFAALVLCDTGAKVGTDESGTRGSPTIKRGGVESIADMVLERWFTAGFPRPSPGRTGRFAGHADAHDRTGIYRRLRRPEARRSSSIRRRDRRADPLPGRRRGWLDSAGHRPRIGGSDQGFALRGDRRSRTSAEYRAAGRFGRIDRRARQSRTEVGRARERGSVAMTAVARRASAKPALSVRRVRGIDAPV